MTIRLSDKERAGISKKIGSLTSRKKGATMADCRGVALTSNLDLSDDQIRKVLVNLGAERRGPKSASTYHTGK